MMPLSHKRRRLQNKVKTKSTVRVKQNYNLFSNLEVGIVDTTTVFFKEQPAIKKEVISLDLSWTSLLSEEKISRKELVEVVNGVRNTLSNGFFKDFDSILVERLNEKLPPETMVTLLRTSFLCRDKLSEWKNTLKKVKGWIENKGLDVDRVLVGLL